MEAKILSTIALFVGLGGAIPVAIQLAGEERTGDWIARVAPGLNWLTKRRALIVASLLPLLVVPSIFLGLISSGAFSPDPSWQEITILWVGPTVVWAVGVTVLYTSIRSLPKVAERLQDKDKSISTLVLIGAVAIVVAFWCQMAAVWLA